MGITIEQVEQLREKTGISYAEAKAALEAVDGDLLEAIIKLEREGKTAHESAAYSTNGATPEPFSGSESSQGNNNTGNSNNGASRDSATGNGNASGAGNGNTSGNHSGNRNYYDQDTTGFGEFLNKVWKGFLRLFHRGNINHFEVFHHGNSIIRIPTTVLVLLLIFGFWFVLPALLIGLFFGCRYRFKGPDLGREDINRVMDSVGDTAENLKQSMKDAADEHSQQE